MKHRSVSLSIAGLLGTILLGPAVTFAAPGDGLATTKHDFSGTGTPSTGLCSFCHTPHKAQATALLWNHQLSSNTFKWDDPTTTGGTNYPTFVGDSYKGPTAKCLSCHDGSVAIGDVGWWNGGKPANPLNNTQLTGAYQIGGAGNMSGNHPVAMPFPLGGVANTYNGSTNGAPAVASGWQANPEAAGIRLFHDDGAGNIAAGSVGGQSGIECTSCHDPHNGADVQDVYLLRGLIGGNTAEYICVKCHNK